MLRSPALRRGVAVLGALLALTSPLSAQLAWSVFNETAVTPAPASTSTSGVTVTVPPGQRLTLIATNFVPVDWTTATSGTVVVTVNFKVSGGLSAIGAGTRALAFGLFNHNGTATNFADDSGYFTWLNGRATGSLAELRRRNGNGVSPSLLNPSGTAFAPLGTGTTVQTVGALTDGANYSLQFQLIRSATGVSLGNTSSTTTGAGVWISGEGLSQTSYTNPDVPPATTLFNEAAFMFLNTTAADVTLTLNSVTGLTPVNPPGVATPPAALIVNPGQPANFSVEATGTAPLAYQWRKDGTSVAGATSAALTVANPQAADAGSYSVVITNAYGTVTSPAAALTVTTATVPATITRQPAALTLNAGQTAVFTVGAFGSAPVAYQWNKDGVAVAGATASTLTLANVAPAQAGNYTVTVANAGGSVTSTPAALAINTAPTLTTQPTGATVAAGGNVTLTVAATGSPAPTYQWQRNGANVAGATNASLALTNVQAAQAGVYTVRVANSVGAVTSAPALVAIPSPMAAIAFTPAPGAGAVNIDTPLRVTFDRAPVAGNFGRIRIHQASDGAVVDTLDMGVTPYRRSIGTQTVDFIFYPILVTGNTAAIYPHAGVLAYGRKYYVTIEPGAILDTTGATFAGTSDSTAWTFTTKAAGPATDTTALTVAADGSGDFTTVQGAIDFVPAGNTTRRVITVKKGLYNEIIYVGSSRPFITLRGEDRSGTEIAYANNANFNSLTGNNRAMVSIDANDFVLETITLRNTTPAGGSQAEAIRGNGARCVFNRVNLISLQDTLLWNNPLFVTDSYIEGDVDFMWSNGPCFFQRCELKMVRAGFYTQVRNGATGMGFVYVDCRLTAPASLTGGGYLGRIDPNPGNFPYSQCVWVNCAMGPHIDPAGWQLNNATASSTIQYWEYKSTDLNGATLDVSRRHPSSRQLTDAEATLFRNPAYVLGGWSPQIAPTIETAPAATSSVTGGNARLTVVANGAPSPALQWFKDGIALPGATTDTLRLPAVQAADAGRYTVTATNAAGSVTSAAGVLTVTRGAFAGTYFGTVGGGTFALYVRDNGSAVLIAANAGAAGTVIARSATVDGNGRLRATLGAFEVDAAIAANGDVNGAAGPAAGSDLAAPSAVLTGARASATGATQAYAGYFQAGATNSAASASVIVAADGRVFGLVQNGSAVGAGGGTVDAGGRVSLAPSGAPALSATLVAGGAALTGTLANGNGTALAVAGAGDVPAGAQRFREFSARAVVTPAAPATVGFVLTGDTPSTVLLRAVGPTLGDAFAVAGALTNPRLDVYRGTTLIASNTGWTSAGSLSDVALATAQVGAFPLRAGTADSALRLTLAPGPYTAVMTSANNQAAGTGLLEVYDVSFGAAGQRLVNVSISGLAGTGTTTLIAGLAVATAQPKRLLIRGAGPALGALGVTNPLARPMLSLFRGTTQVVQNTGWSGGSESAAIAGAAAEVRAFPFAPDSADAAILINLGGGLYTAAVSSPDATTGLALIEFYELP